MPELRPFRATRYTDAAGDPGDLLAPPYDVIDTEEARGLRARSPYNAVRLVLPEGDAPYRRAAERLQAWLRAGLLERDGEPALWLHGQSFELEGVARTRYGVLSALRVTGFEEGEVLPHEETHRGPREDRLALLRATRTQLSPIFLVAPDPSGRLSELVDRARRGEPRIDTVTPDGVRHRLWRVPAGPLAREIAGAAGSEPLLIADGHHRYETALTYARERPEEAAGWTLACVVGAGDPGLACLPTHRALEAAPPGAGRAAPWRSFLDASFTVAESVAASAEEAAAAVQEEGDAIACLPGGDEPPLRLRHREGAPELERVPTVAFDRRVLRRGWECGPDAAVERGLLSYHREPGAAKRAAGPEGAAFLLPALPVERTWSLAREGVRLPPKSTYFWPKLPSGLLFRSLAG